MKRVALLTTSLLTLAACSSGSDTAPPPPLDTEAPTTTVEPPATEAPDTTTTSTTTTTVAETTTTSTAVAETTTTAEPTAVPASDAPAPQSDDPTFTDAFESYERAWVVRRAAVAAPADEMLREKLAEFHSETSFAPIEEFLDGLTESDLQAIPNEEQPSRIEFIRGESLSADGTVAGIVVCEVLTDIGVDRTSGEVVRAQVDAFLNQVFLERSGDGWIIQTETISTSFPEQDECQ